MPTNDPPINDVLADAAFETLCTHYAEDRGAERGSLVPPIYQTATFVLPDAAAFEQRHDDDCPYFDYTRGGNPTNALLEAKLARLENGTWCTCFASGMGAITAAINACTHAGAHVVATARSYPPTVRYLDGYLRDFGVTVTFVTGADPADYESALRPETTLIYLESPTSVDFHVPEIRPITALARGRGIRTIFDNSWATPYFQRPLEFDCDLVVHSISKYLGGHSDLVAGAVIGREEALRQKLATQAELLGATLDPFAGWLMIRGLRTLALRMDRHHESGLTIARHLDAHPKVARVNHPGLETHAHHAVARQQLTGYASLFSIELADPTHQAAHRFIDSLKLFQTAVSWGGPESLAITGLTTYPGNEDPTQQIRIHAGLEAPEDLIKDLERALDN